jgi:putative addiction module component (TIGR02574 family)
LEKLRKGVGRMNMDTKSQAVLEAALALPEAERAEVAAELLATLGPEDATLADDELATELERRLEECRQHPSATIPWSVLKDMP